MLRQRAKKWTVFIFPFNKIDMDTVCGIQKYFFRVKKWKLKAEIVKEGNVLISMFSERSLEVNSN